MILTKKLEIESLIGIALIAVFSFFIVRSNALTPTETQLSVSINAAGNAFSIVPVINPKLQINTATQPSPDGTKKVILTTTNNKNDTLTYLLKTADSTGGNQHILFSTTSATLKGLNVPFNSWSPDDKYVFIQKSGGEALVFKASGEEIITGQQYIDVEKIFDTTPRNEYYHETTGWASSTLLIVNSVTKDNIKGSSYWFEVPSKAIIQLSSQF